MNWILSRLQEPSTWRGLVLVATALGAKWSPDSQQAVITIGIGAAGVLGAILPDTFKKK